MRKTREERRAVTRARLLRAAARTFARRGVAGASVDDVAEQAGFTKGAVYGHFASKDDLVLALVDRHAAAELEAVAEAAAAGRTAADLLGDRYVAAGDGRRRVALATAFWLEAVGNPRLRRRLARAGRAHREALAGLLEGEATTASRPALPPDDAATVLAAMAHGLAMQRAVDRRSVPDDLLARAATALLAPVSATGGWRRP